MRKKETKKIASRARGDEPLDRLGSEASPLMAFEFAGCVTEPGSISRVELPVARLPTGTKMALPAIVLHGAKPGPVLWLSAAIHGDEINGVAIVDEIVRQIDPQRLSGTVLAVPMVNVFGLIHGSRYLPDRRDLNRCFPGSRRGSLGARLAHLFCDEIVHRADVGIDFHTGSNGRTNLPQIRCDLDHAETSRLAEVFGATVAVHSSLRDGSLRAYAVKCKKPLLLYEAGEASRLSAKAIDVGVEGTLRVMSHLGMRKTTRERKERAVQLFRKSTWTRVHQSGLCRIDVDLGQPVNKGDHLGWVINPAEGTRSSVCTKESGLVIGRATDGLVHRGDAVVHIAQFDA